MNHVIYNIAHGWNVEAKMENSKYFYFYKEVQAVLNNRKCYVIGRKGSGKSAICQHITSISDYNTFSAKLSFKAFPYNLIYNLQDAKFSHPNQYITIWKYIIYSHILKLMIKNQAVDSSIRSELEKIYPPSKIKSLHREITEWTSAEFGVDVFGYGGSLKIGRSFRPSNKGWIDYVEIMEDIIRDNCGNARYYIVFDELDDDYRNVTETNQFNLYIELLTSLFKAVQDIRSIFSKERGYRIMPIIVLRNDIYSQIHDNDKNKWEDLSVTIDWNPVKLKELLAFRINQDDPQCSRNPQFDKEWGRIFTPELIGAGDGKKKKLHSFEYMANSTLLRPRDFIKYVKACCEIALDDSKEIISTEVLRDVDRAFSNYLKQEFHDELLPILPDIDRIFDVMSYQRQWIFSPNEFKESYNKEIQLGNIKETNVDKVLETLYNFSVIGVENKNVQSKHYFKYINTNMAYNRYENIVIHRGLFKALGIE